MRQMIVGGVVLALACMSGMTWAQGSWHPNGNLSIGYDSNANNGVEGNVQHESWMTHGDIGLEYRYRWTPQTTWALKTLLAGEQVERFEELGNLKFQLRTRVRHRFSDHADSLSLSLWGSVATWQFRNDLRDSMEYRGGLFFDQPLSLSVDWRTGLNVTERRAEQGKFFDLSTQSVFSQLDWQLMPQVVMYAEYQYQRGDIASTGIGNPRLRAATNVRGPDTAFNEAGKAMIVYRLDGHSHITALGANVIVAPHWAIDGRVQYINSEAKGGLEYERWIAVMSLLTQF